MFRNLLLFFTLTLQAAMFNACNPAKEKADLLIFNAHIYTADSADNIAKAMVISDGKIKAVGSSKLLMAKYQATEKKDMQGKFIYPGFIDAHSHFTGYAKTLQMANLSNAGSFDEVIDLIKTHSQEFPSYWITGRGWDQNKWDIKEFPNHKALSLAFPDQPVVLIRVDGHAVIANKKAMELSGMYDRQQFPEGEALLQNGKLTGVFLENTADEIKQHIPRPDAGFLANLMLAAEKRCFEVGLTSVCDAGLDKSDILFIDSLQRKGLLSIRIYAMLNPTSENIENIVNHGFYLTDHLTVRSIKLYADGALGSRGARLIEPYNDAPGYYGVWVHDEQFITDMCALAFNHGYQMCIHCIGDAAVRRVLHIYGSFLKNQNDLRWRIEHAQVVHPDDFQLFGKFSVVPSIQSVHATSDMAWAGKRLGEQRLKYAYAQKTLLQQNGWIPNGSDFPVEDIHPLLNFYAAVSRKTPDGYPPSGFNPEQAFSREEALKSITIWAAMANFEENQKGSIEPGKYADFVVLDRNIMTIPEMEIPHTKVLETYLSGKKVY